MALQNGVIAFLLQDTLYPVQISCFTTTKDRQMVSIRIRIKQSSSIFTFGLHLTNVVLCDLNTSNLGYLEQRVCVNVALDLYVHNTFPPLLPLSSVCVLLPILIFSFQSEIWLFHHSGVASSVLTLRLVFCGYYLMKLPAEERL